MKNTVVQELITTADSIQQNEVCVSLYIHKDTSFETQLAELLRPTLSTMFKDNSSSSNSGELYKDIYSQLNNIRDTQTDKADGYGVFFIIDTQQSFNGKDQMKLRFIKVVPLFSVVENEIFTGKTFSVAQLLYSLKVEPKAFALDISRERANLYLVDRHECTHMHTFETEILPAGDAEYSEVQGATGIVQGSGQDKVERRKVEENKYLLHQLKDVLTEMQEQVQDVGKLVVAYTTQFNTIIDPFIQKLQNEVQPAEVIPLAKNIRDGKELQNEVETILNERFSGQAVQELNAAQELFERFALDTEMVCNAVGQGGVQKLFIKTNQSLSGYVTDAIIFSKEKIQDSSVYCENILPFLVVHVCKTDGEISVFTTTTENTPMLAALLRYEKEKIATVS